LRCDRDGKPDSTSGQKRLRAGSRLIECPFKAIARGSTQREPSQFESVEANLQQRAEQELGQTYREGRGRGRGRGRSRGRPRAGGRGRGRGRGRGGRGGEASAEPISEQQQGASNGEGFYGVFQI